MIARGQRLGPPTARSSVTAQRLRTRRPVAVKPFFPLGHGGPVGPISRRFHSPEIRTAISASEDANRAQTYFRSNGSITNRSVLATLKLAHVLRLRQDVPFHGL